MHRVKSQLQQERNHENRTYVHMGTFGFCELDVTHPHVVWSWGVSMMELHELNTEARKVLLWKLSDTATSIIHPSDMALLLVANFLREISDMSHEINDSLNQISNTLQGIEMNTRPKL